MADYQHLPANDSVNATVVVVEERYVVQRRRRRAQSEREEREQKRRGKLAVIYGFGFMCFQNENGAGRQPAQGLQGEGGLLSTATMIGGICK